MKCGLRLCAAWIIVSPTLLAGCTTFRDIKQDMSQWTLRKRTKRPGQCPMMTWI